MELGSLLTQHRRDASNGAENKEPQSYQDPVTMPEGMLAATSMGRDDT